MSSDFNSFLRTHCKRFPYNRIRKPRRSFHVKWLFLEAPNGSYIVIPSVCLNKQTQMQLLISLQALPATREMDDIIEYMECWGRQEDAVWYHKVIDWLAFTCREGIKRESLDLSYDCIALIVRRTLEIQGASTSTQLTRTVIVGWIGFFMRE